MHLHHGAGRRRARRDLPRSWSPGGAELGKSLMFWLDLAVKVTGSEDCIDDDGDGDYGVVAERLASLRQELTGEAI